MSHISEISSVNVSIISVKFMSRFCSIDAFHGWTFFRMAIYRINIK